MRSHIDALITAVILAALLCLGLVVMAQDDPHDGQPEHCTNAKTAPKAHKCDCKKAPEDAGGMGCEIEDVKCRVYCRKDKCYCYHGGCDS